MRTLCGHWPNPSTWVNVFGRWIGALLLIATRLSTAPRVDRDEPMDGNLVTDAIIALTWGFFAEVGPWLVQSAIQTYQRQQAANVRPVPASAVRPNN